MISKDSLPQDVFEYLGARVAKVSEAEIETAIPIHDKNFHRHVHHVIGELTHNAALHKPDDHSIARLSVNHDSIGTYVEITNVSRVEDAEVVIERIERCRDATDEEITEWEVETYRANLGTDKGGIGLYQVMKSALRGPSGSRFASAEPRPRTELGLVDLVIRIYVWSKNPGVSFDS